MKLVIRLTRTFRLLSNALLDPRNVESALQKLKTINRHQNRQSAEDDYRDEKTE